MTNEELKDLKGKIEHVLTTFPTSRMPADIQAASIALTLSELYEMTPK